MWGWIKRRAQASEDAEPVKVEEQVTEILPLAELLHRLLRIRLARYRPAEEDVTNRRDIICLSCGVPYRPDDGSYTAMVCCQNCQRDRTDYEDEHGLIDPAEFHAAAMVLKQKAREELGVRGQVLAHELTLRSQLEE